MMPTNETETPSQPLRLRRIGPETYTTYLGDIEYVPASALAEAWEKAIAVVKDLLPELEANYEAEKPMGFIGASYELGQTKDIIELLETARYQALSAGKESDDGAK